MARPVYDFRFQDEDEVEPPLTRKHDLRLSITLRRTGWIATGCRGVLYHQTTALWLKIANEKEIECDFATITEVELGNVLDKCTWIFVIRMARCTREAVCWVFELPYIGILRRTRPEAKLRRVQRATRVQKTFFLRSCHPDNLT